MRINLDFAKVYYSLSIAKDKDIEGCIPRTTTIPEELGRIQFLLSDKTGTLTQNEMVFKKVAMEFMQFNLDDVLLQREVKAVAQLNQAPNTRTIYEITNLSDKEWPVCTKLADRDGKIIAMLPDGARVNQTVTFELPCRTETEENKDTPIPDLIV